MADRPDSTRLNVTLAPEHAAKLSRLAEQAYTQEGTLARSLLSRAIDEADVDSRGMVELLNGIPGGSAVGNALVLGNAVAQSFQIVAMERFAPRYDARALTFLQMAVSCLAFSAIAVARGELSLPRDGSVWYALVVTGDVVNDLTALVGDPNVSIHENKAFVCNVEKA